MSQLLFLVLNMPGGRDRAVGGVTMARKPEVFVRELTDEEGQQLVCITRTSRDRVRLRRAMIVLASAQGRLVNDIATLIQGTQGYVREVVHAFNQHGSRRWTQNGAGPASEDR